MTILRQRMTEDMQVRNLSPHTQASYLQQVSPFARYFRTSPNALTPEHIRTYQIYLTNEKKLAPNSIHLAVAALRKLALCRQFLQMPPPAATPELKKDYKDHYEALTGISLKTCPLCRCGTMVVIETFECTSNCASFADSS